MARLLSLVMLAGLILGCSPVYRTFYTFVPPEDPLARTCTIQCDNQKLQCQQLRDMEYERCRDRAELDYERCEDRNRYRREDDKDYCYRRYCASPNYEHCEANYRSCFQACGGEVMSETRCVSFCEGS